MYDVQMSSGLSKNSLADGKSGTLRHVPLLPLDDVVWILAQQNRVEEKRAPVHQILEPAQSTGIHFLEEVGKKFFQKILPKKFTNSNLYSNREFSIVLI
jgi:hypothetical protein